MTSRQQWGLVGAIVIALGGGLFAASYFMKDQLFPVTYGSTAPDFRAKVVGENTYKSMADYRGHVVLLNVWATWCAPCIVEMPSIDSLYRDYGPKGLKVVALSIDNFVTEDSIRAFAKNLNLSFDILNDRKGDIERAYQTTGYPETFVIAKDGTIRRKWIGAADWNSQGHRALIAQLLGLETPRTVTADRE